MSSTKGGVRGKTVSSVISKNNSKDSTKNKSSSKDPNRNLPIMSFSQNTVPPIRVSDLIEDVKHIKLSMSKLDQIEKKNCKYD